MFKTFAVCNRKRFFIVFLDVIISSFFISLVNLHADQRAFSWVLAPFFLSVTSVFQRMKIYFNFIAFRWNVRNLIKLITNTPAFQVISTSSAYYSLFQQLDNSQNRPHLFFIYFSQQVFTIQKKAIPL